MTKKDQAARLLDRFLRRRASREEIKQVNRWYDAYEQENPVIDENRKETLKQEMYGTILKKIQKEPVQTRAKILPVRYLLPAAALLLLTIGATLLLMHPSAPAKTTSIAGLVRTESQSRAIVLEDGTHINLRPFTEIKTGHRKVTLLSGEAFFKVFHDPSHPFTVLLRNGMYVRVLGTSFNIRSPQPENGVSIRVQSGRVAVGNARQLLGIFTRGDQIDYDPQSVSASISHDHIEKRTFHFDHTPLQVLTKRLEKEYDVLIEVPGSVAALQCTGNFDNTQDIKEILQNICLLHHLKLDKSTDPENFTIRR